MAGPNTGPVVPLEVLVEQNVVAPMLILPPAVIAMGRPASFFVADEQAGQPSRDLLADLQESHLASRANRTLDLKVVSQVSILVNQGSDEHELHRHPDRPAPVRVSPEHPAVRVAPDIPAPVPLSRHPAQLAMVG